MPTFEIEDLYSDEVVCGIDEAGLGPLAGPLVVAACRIERDLIGSDLLAMIDDSKRLTVANRERAADLLFESAAVEYNVAIIENDVIDNIGLSKAWVEGIIEAASGLEATLYILDGNRKVEISGRKTVTAVGGDRKSYSVAAASIIAKVTRDRIMRRI
ncbi:MAG: hypothetical protein LBJ69_03995, partial [Holosporales bacterium]|nr:hypothetical protein [Holosporales bacterium]